LPTISFKEIKLDGTKYIGLLGLGSFSTSHYLNLFNSLYNEKHGGYSTCPLVMLNVNFDLINPHLPNDFEKLVPITTESLSSLNDLEPQLIVVPNITLHETINKLPADLQAKIIHPIIETARALKENDIREVFVFGTKYTMNSRYLVEVMGQYDVKVNVPDLDDQNVIDQVRQNIYRGEQDQNIHELYLSICKKYNQMAPIVLGCTELSLVNYNKQYDIFDMVKIQIAQAIATLE